MGEAKRRGTFEDRKAQAIAAGRIKMPSKQQMIAANPKRAMRGGIPPELLAAVALAAGYSIKFD